MEELRRMGAQNVVVSSNADVRRDGLPTTEALRKQYDDPGCATYFLLRGQSQCIACDAYTEIKDNVRASFYAVEGLRQIERAGASDLLRRAFAGFKALPPGQEPAPPWKEALGVSSNASEQEIKHAYRAAARRAHPDAGGSHEEMAALNRAFAEALNHLKERQ
jgi:DnaJ-domain-containing protein 1